MILLRQALEPTLEDLGIEGYHIGGTIAISLVSKCGEPVLVFYDFAVKNSFTRAERDFIVSKLEVALAENVGTIADIEDAKAELKTIKIDERVNTKQSTLKYLFHPKISLIIYDNGEVVLKADEAGVDDLHRAMLIIPSAVDLLTKALVQKERIKELKRVIDKGKACFI